MHPRSRTVRRALGLGLLAMLGVLVLSACGGVEKEAEVRHLPDEAKALQLGEYRTEQFEPAFSFRVGEGWSTAQPEAYDLLLITRADEGGALGFTNLEGARFFKPTNKGTTYMTDVPKDVVGWFQRHPYLETQGTDPVKVGGVEGVRMDLVVGDLPRDHSGACGPDCDARRCRLGGGKRADADRHPQPREGL
jgi:hypothetical protein